MILEPQKYTHQLLKKYGWEYRHMEVDNIIPEEIKQKIDRRIKENFTGIIKWVGPIPYLTWANLLGVQEKIRKEDEDSLIGFIAPPGTGKTTQALGAARFIDKGFDNSRTIFTMEQLKKFLKKSTSIYNEIKKASQKGEYYENPLNGKVVVLDEGVYLLFSGDGASKNGKTATKIFSIIRALNVIFLVNITNWRRISMGVKEDRFMINMRIPAKGYMEFFSKRRISQINLHHNDVKKRWPKSNFGEYVGYIDKNCQFWRDYSAKKAEFMEDAMYDD